MNALKTQFCAAQEIGGQAEYKRQRTRRGIKDTFQSFFAEQLFHITAQRGRSRGDKETHVREMVSTMPYVENGVVSPVWHIKGMCSGLVPVCLRCITCIDTGY